MHCKSDRSCLAADFGDRIYFGGRSKATQTGAEEFGIYLYAE